MINIGRLADRDPVQIQKAAKEHQGLTGTVDRGRDRGDGQHRQQTGLLHHKTDKGIDSYCCGLEIYRFFCDI